MSEQQLKQFLYNVLDRKNKTINTIYNDSKYVKQLKTMVEHLGITEKCFKTDVTSIVTMTLEESKNDGYIASILIFSMELDAYLNKNSSSWYKRSMLIETLIPILCKHCKKMEYSCFIYLVIFIISTILILLIK